MMIMVRLSCTNYVQNKGILNKGLMTFITHQYDLITFKHKIISPLRPN